MLQEIQQPESQSQWDILNRLNSLGLKIEIKPGKIVAHVILANEEPVTAEELEARFGKHIIIPCQFVPSERHSVPVCKSRRSPIYSWRRPWTTERDR